jgi:CBS domain-containing protein
MLDELVPGGPTLAELAARHPTTIVGDDALDDALGTLAEAHLDWAPVVSEGSVVGVISNRDVMSAYRHALAGNVRKVRGITTGGTMLETRVEDGSPLAGQKVAQIPWPSGALLVALERDERLIVPSGGLILQVGDRLSVLADPAAEANVRKLLEPQTLAGPTTTD